MTTIKEDIKIIRESLRKGKWTIIFRLTPQWFANNGFFVQCKIAEVWCNLIHERDDEEKLRICREFVNNIETGLIWQELDNQTFDCTQMNVGDFLPDGELIERCPKCGKPGIVLQEEHWGVTHHKLRFHGGACEILDNCDLYNWYS